MKAIKKLKNTGSGGEDKLPNIFFKNVALEIAFPLSGIFNLSTSASCIPTIWKSGIVVAICQKGSTSDVSNYRTITLTCITCKIMEAIIKDDIISHFWKHKLI